MRERIVQSLVLLLVAAILTACPQADGTPPVTKPPPTQVVPTKTPSVKVHLVGWSFGGPLDDLLRYLMDQCAVTYELVETDYWNRLPTMFAAGEEFDILYVDPVHVPSFVDSGYLAPVDESAGIRWEEFIKPLADGFTFEDTHYGVPMEFAALALFYNRDLFAEADLKEPNDEWRWEDLEEAARIITDHIGVAGFSVPAQDWVFAPFVLQAGGRIMSPDFSDTLLDSEETIWAGEFYIGARLEGWGVTPQDVGVDRQREAFGRGDVAMMLEGYWTHPYLSEQYPDLNYGAVQPPAGPGGEGNLAFATGLGVSAYSSAPQAAWKAVACLTSKDAQLLLLESGGALPSRQGYQVHPYFEDNPVARAVYAGGESAAPYRWGPRHDLVSMFINFSLWWVYEDGLSVRKSFQKAAEEIRSVIWE